MIKEARGLFTSDSLSGSLAVYLSANALFRALALVRGVVLTWLLTQAQFGGFQLGLLMANVLLPLLSLGLYEGLTRFVPEFETRGQLWSFIKRVMPAGIAGGLVLSAIGVPLAMAAGGVAHADAAAEFNGTQPLTVAVAVCVGSLMVYHSVVAVLRGRRMFRALSLMELSTAALFTIAAILAALLGAGRAAQMLDLYSATNILGAAVFGAPCLLAIVRDPKQISALPPGWNVGEVLGYSLWAGLAAATWQLLMLVPAWYLNVRCGQEAFAIVSAVRVFTQLGYIIPAGIAVALASSVTKRWARGQREGAIAELNLYTKASLGVMLVGCAVAASGAELLMKLFPREYAAGASVVDLMLTFYLLTGAAGLITVRFTLLQKSVCIFASWAAGCVVAALFSMLWIYPTSDPAEALEATGWCSLFGIAGALAVTLILLYQEELPPDRGTLVMLAGVVVLPASLPWRLAVVTGLVVLAAVTPLVMNNRERQSLASYVRQRIGSAKFKQPSE